MRHETTEITVLCGSFDSQPLVFAHLLDAFPGADLDHVDVICRQDPARRLRHYLAEDDARKIEDWLGLADTCVLVFPGASSDPLHGTDKLTMLGQFPGQRPVPGPI